MYRSARGLAVPRRRARTHRRDLEPRRVIGVIAEHGHVVPLSGFLRGTATPGVSASHARCRVTIGMGETRGKVSVSIDRARVRVFGRRGSRVRAKTIYAGDAQGTPAGRFARELLWLDMAGRSAPSFMNVMWGPRGKDVVGRGSFASARKMRFVSASAKVWRESSSRRITSPADQEIL